MTKIKHVCVVFLLITVPAFATQASMQSPSDRHSDAAVPSGTDPAAAVTLYEAGGVVRSPRLIKSVDPKFSEQARSAKFSGAVTVGLYVDEKGMPRDVHVVRGMGYGLDEPAMAAVRQYRFAPGTRDGVPVPVRILVKVSFESF